MVVDARGRAVRHLMTFADESVYTDQSARFAFPLVPLGQHTLAAWGDIDLVAARFHAKRCTLRERIVDVTRAEDLDLGGLVVEVE